MIWLEEVSVLLGWERYQQGAILDHRREQLVQMLNVIKEMGLVLFKRNISFNEPTIFVKFAMMIRKSIMSMYRKNEPR